MADIKLKVNEKYVAARVEDRTLLVQFLRDGLTGTHVGCDTSQCGAWGIVQAAE